jgi:hypothetical protein
MTRSTVRVQGCGATAPAGRGQDESWYERFCKGEFAGLSLKLDRLDEAIRGNGKPGILRRLDRLEALEAIRSRLTWLVVGAAVTLGATAAWNHFFGG